MDVLLGAPEEVLRTAHGIILGQWPNLTVVVSRPFFAGTGVLVTLIPVPVVPGGRSRRIPAI